jgi:hypothetical protein
MTTAYIAAFGVVGFAGGVIAGGFITRKFRLNGNHFLPKNSAFSKNISRFVGL